MLFYLLVALVPTLALAVPTPYAIPDNSCGTNKYQALALSQRGGYSPKTPWIVGGVDTKVNEFPWQVSMYQSGYHTCGGSIIGKRWILTAAHCCTGSLSNPSIWKINSGRHNVKAATETGMQSHTVSRVIRHPQHSSLRNTNDIALLELTKDLVFDEHVQPICLPHADDGLFVDEDSIITGWGALRENGAAATTLQKVTVPVITNAACQKAYPTETIAETMLCAGFQAGGKDSCQGDSGGPQHFVGEDGRMVQIGVVSWGYGCARAGYPGVYTRTTSYIDWIKTTTGLSF